MSTTLLRPLALSGITLYQRHISPIKGFRCAYGSESGARSCSAFGKHVFQRYDVGTATALLRRRFAACKSAYQRLRERHAHTLSAASFGGPLTIVAAHSASSQTDADREAAAQRRRESRVNAACDCASSFSDGAIGSVGELACGACSL
jgi:putative component of membrane protein insertase Oxa1/YidC/SpoIIIJ protein YidD